MPIMQYTQCGVKSIKVKDLLSIELMQGPDCVLYYLACSEGAVFRAKRCSDFPVM